MTATPELINCPIERIVRADNPRKEFDEAKLAELTESIRERGIIEPLIVRRLPGDQFELVQGERRWRAAQRAGLREVPVVVRVYDHGERTTRDMFEEQANRADWTDLEYAQWMKRLMQEEGITTQEELAQRINRSTAFVSRHLQLLQVPAEVRELVERKKLTTEHVAALAGKPEAEQVRLARRAAKQGISARNLRQETKKSPNIREMEERLQRNLGCRVEIVAARDQNGEIRLKYRGYDEFDRLSDKLLA